MTIYQVILTMLSAGLLGGIVNYGLARTTSSTWSDLFWSIAIGTGAAFLVPLFLNTISSSLLTGILDNTAHNSDIFVFFGFCLLGSIASKTMIRTLTQKILRTAEEAKKEVQNLKEEVAPVLIKETEPEIEEVLNNGGIKTEAFGSVGDDTRLVIKALGNSKYARRTVGGIKSESKVSEQKVFETLNWLQSNGLGFSTGDPKHYWSLSEKGQRVFKELN